ncbi:TROVE domain-containing protein [Rubinisphaera sp.]|uniref:TROVE domain-containing protein n=1 Tax=Rubinisphaera sp. TaxID=2024857 RepID=UPI000C0D71F5|nr:TROVE domain-containing protein [Rubinisphaera sp.]MBV10707.1 RNA-binding protein [Rubinisphaera sp.]|tara:strand:+ start:2161 stop:3738 length:1578 start_codon:yes stop_codon:yes gene_type:complete
MANKNLFNTLIGKIGPKANARNEAGGLAYQMSPKQALAQYAATGCFNGTFYSSGADQVDAVLELCEQIEPEFIARTALYARNEGHMKDMPALLCAVLSVKAPGLLIKIFNQVIDSPKMLRNFVQIMRSGVVGRKSLGTMPKQLVRNWLESRSDEQLFIGSIGNDPSLTDVIKMVHPKPATPERSALYAYLIGREYDRDSLPELASQYEKFKRNTNPGKVTVPDVPFQMLTALPLTKKDWEQIARNASWQMTRMNLNTFLRHGVFESAELTGIVANRLRNPRKIAAARVFPYQLMAAFMNSANDVPQSILNALQDAMEIAIKNVPRVTGKVYVFPDVSGSMHSPVTGHRVGSTSKVRCLDVAALVAAAILRKNPEAEVIPFESKAIPCRLNPRDSVMTNARTLASLPAGGTNCSAPLEYLNRQKAKGDLLIYVSDNESWLDSPHYGWCGGGTTATMQEWASFKRRNRQAKMVCIDIQPYANTQAVERADIVNVGGFSDQVFKLIANVSKGQASENHWVNEIERMRL